MTNEPASEYEAERKQRVQASVLAKSLFDEFVQTPIDWGKTLQINTDPTSPIGKKARLYQYASVLLALLNAEQNNRAFTSVRLDFERLFFPSTFAEGAELLETVKRAMRDLSELMHDRVQPLPLSWAVRWLGGVGVRLDNPVDLAMFTLRWQGHFLTAAKAVNHFEPFA